MEEWRFPSVPPETPGEFVVSDEEWFKKMWDPILDYVFKHPTKKLSATKAHEMAVTVYNHRLLYNFLSTYDRCNKPKRSM